MIHVAAWTVFLILFGFCSKYVFDIWYNRRLLSAIPSPKGNFLIGNLLMIITTKPEDIFNLIRQLAKDYWPIYRVSAIYVTTINILHPADFEIILSGTKHMQKSKLYSFLENWLGEGLLTSYGQKWQTRRKILTPAFHFNILQQFLTIFNEETAKMVSRFEEVADKEPVNIVPFVTQMTLQSIGETAMGMKNIDKERQDAYKESIYTIGQLFLVKLVKPWIRLPFVYRFSSIGRKEKVEVAKLHEFSNNVILEREKMFLKNRDSIEKSYNGKKKMAMLDLLLSAKHNGENIDYNGIREEVDTFMFEGHDTTAMAISFLLFCLAYYQDVQMKVSQEIDEVIGLSSSKPPTYNDLQELKYTERVIKETLRLYPSVPFISRLASESFTTHTGYFIPKGSILHMHIFDLHRHPSIYEDPEKFDPDRFLPENCKDRHPFAFIPFSAGPRNCIGQRFAMLEIKSVVCGVLRKFRLETMNKPSDIKFMPDLVLRTETEIKIKFITK